MRRIVSHLIQLIATYILTHFTAHLFYEFRYTFRIGFVQSSPLRGIGERFESVFVGL
jgi:hypothetical protein